MNITVHLVVCDDDGHEETFTDVVVLEKACQRIEHLGLTLAEAKQTLTALQQRLVEQQTRAVKKLEITVPAAVTPNYMERLGTDGRFREASSQRHGMLTPRWKGQSSEIPTSPGSLTGAEAGYRPETPRPLPPPGEHRLPPRTPVLTTAGV